MGNKKNVLICGNFIFPNPSGNASGNLVYGFGRILRDLGYEVSYCGISSHRSESSSILKNHTIVDGFHIYEMQASVTSGDWINIKCKYEECKTVIKHIGEENIKFLLFYGAPVLGYWITAINKYAHKHGIKTIYYAVDWIESTGEGRWLRNFIKYIDTNYKIRYAAKKTDGIIAVSRFLENYFYKSKQCVLRIPPIGEFEPIHKKHNQDITFIYSGSSYSRIVNRPPRRIMNENLDKTVDIVYILKNRGVRTKFQIYGTDKEKYLSYYPRHKKVLQKLENDIVFNGLVEKDELKKAISGADFLFFNRTETKSTKAGFPSRVCESLCLGTPVITTPTSDLKEYIKDGINGLIIDFDRSRAADQIEALLSDKRRVDRIIQNCKKNSVLDYRNYIKKTKEFLNKVERG